MRFGVREKYFLGPKKVVFSFLGPFCFELSYMAPKRNSILFLSLLLV
jgi:hypothetical protein